MKKQFRSESELAAVVVAWLEDLKWDVYQEVGGAPRADIVGVQGPIVWVIETKLSFSLDLLGQAQHWTEYAHYVSCAIPHRRGTGLAENFATMLGLGVLKVSDGVFETIRPKLRRRISDWLRNEIRPEHKTFAKAGSQGGGYWTPFQQTCRNIRDEVQKHSDGITMKDLMGKVSHHYSSTGTARSVMLRWIAAGCVSGVVMDDSQRPFKIFPCEVGKEKPEAAASQVN